MSTGEGEGPRDGQSRRDGDERRSDRIGVGGGDDSVSRIQLAARWAEAYGGGQGDSLAGVLRRFRAAYEYLDAVIHGVEPPELDSELETDYSRAGAGAAEPPPAPAAPPPPPTEPRPWS
jgi:hypothetical protein